MSRFFLGLDQGTTGITALIFDENWQPKGKGYCEISCQYPAPSYVEHNPEEILSAAKKAVFAAMEEADASPADILSVGMDHEGESVLLFDLEKGEALSPVLVWQDTRTAKDAEILLKEHGKEIKAITGLDADAYFSATKIAYLAKKAAENPAMQGKKIAAATLDTWMLYHFTGKKSFATDASTASRTMLCDLKGGWSEKLKEILGISQISLPEIKDSASLFGITDPRCFLGIEAPVGGILTDQQAALLGQGCTSPGSLKATFGTGCFLLMNTGNSPFFSQNGLVTTVAWQLAGERSYALDGGIYIAGAAMTWLRSIGILNSPKECAQMAFAAGSYNGLVFVPAFNGLGAPYRAPQAQGLLLGITGGTTKEQIVRAAEESIAYQVADVAAAMEKDTGKKISYLRCDGGAAKDGFLMQFTADILGVPVEIPSFAESTGLGAALIGAMGCGLASPENIAHLQSPAKRYEVQMSEKERFEKLAAWHKAVALSKQA